MGHFIVILGLLAGAWSVHPLLAIGLAVAGALYIYNEATTCCGRPRNED